MKDKLTSEETKIIYAYRYLSWALTSFVYLAGGSYSIVFFKLGVIVSLFISSKVITNLYMKFKENKVVLRTLVLIETLGITILLLPTGGLRSPFIWYALNPTLVAACYLPTYFCWLNLIFYLFSGTTMSNALFNPDKINMAEMILENSNLILVFMLITLAVQLMAGLTKKLYAQTIVLEEQKQKMIQINEALRISNIQNQEAIEHIMSLYQIIEALNNHSSKEKLLEVLAAYTARITKSSLSIFWLLNPNKSSDIIKTNKNLKEAEQQEILQELQKLNLQRLKLKEIHEIRVNNKDLLAMSIISSTTYFGLVAIQKNNYSNIHQIEQNIKLLKFLAELSAVTLERFNLEEIEDRLLVMEEQNRIANEIHDSVSQRLFSISYAIHGILGRWSDLSKNDLKDYLVEVRESSNLAMQELRNSIYKLSLKKKGEKSLQVALSAFLDSIAKLQHVIIDFDIKGDESNLSLSLKKGITRIIREACGNAVRHGKCQLIHLDLVLHKDFMKLSIDDDGIGFLLNNEDINEQKSLGISNMKNLVNSFNGSLEINSEIGKGTAIKIIIPSEGFANVERGGLIFENNIDR